MGMATTIMGYTITPATGTITGTTTITAPGAASSSPPSP